MKHENIPEHPEPPVGCGDEVVVVGEGAGLVLEPLPPPDEAWPTVTVAEPEDWYPSVARIW
jgi:hypothetical protein